MCESPEPKELRAALASALRLLSETHDYLLRLPSVPVTRELAAKIAAHVNDPAPGVDQRINPDGRCPLAVQRLDLGRRDPADARRH